jgi:hypothetical protein
VLLGGAGIAQFIAVHAEPRLIAPFVMLVSLGVVTWGLDGTPRRGFGAVASAGLLVALGIGGWHVGARLRITASFEARNRQLEQQFQPALAPHRVVVLGDAFPMLPDLYRARAIVLAQVMAPEVAMLEQWPAPAAQALVSRLRDLGAGTLWRSRGRDSYRIARQTGPDDR